MNKEEVGNGRLKTNHPMRYARQDDVSSVRRLKCQESKLEKDRNWKL
ncbi:MAG: hypothetical protein IBV52_05680 [Candidatus Bathyarchaeota archaeon]